MVSVFAIGPKVRGFKLGRDDGFLRVIKIRNTPSFGGSERVVFETASPVLFCRDWGKSLQTNDNAEIALGIA
jgi:hypothetical protein